MSSSPDPHAHDAARPTGPVYGQEGAYASYPAPATGDVAPPTGPALPPVSVSDAPQGASSRPGHPPHAYGQPGPQRDAPTGYPQPGYPVRPSPPRNDLAVWSLVLGLLGVLGCVFFTGIPAVLVGQSARRAVAAGEADNEGTATAGIVLGWVATGLGALIGALLLLVTLLPLLFAAVVVPIMG